jgi:phosphoadenosine phosphosulfate reductase
MNDIFGDLEKRSLDRLKEFEPPDGYYFADSGGKDSCAVRQLLIDSGCRYDGHHNLTTADPPEVVHFIRKQHLEVTVHRPELTMWQLIRKKGMPPRRNRRYCCMTQKEGGGAGRFVVTGIRWDESEARSHRRPMEACYRDNKKRFLHVIIDWPTHVIWEYIRAKAIPYCCLYDEGFSRVGCVLCPCVENVYPYFERWPSICRAWERAIKATWKPKVDGWKTPEEYWQWWLHRRRPARCRDAKGQRLFFTD